MKEFIQEELTPAQAYFIASDKKFLWFCAGRGCFAKDTNILMFDGTSKKVQDIKIGDSVMGDDYTERIVLRLCFGQEPIYRVKLEDGSYFDCNESHDCIVFNKETGEIEEKKIIHLIGNENLYYHIKKASPEKTISLYKFKINKEKERDSYYGFTLSGNNRFILANSMIITKNSGKCFSPETDFLMYDGTIKNVKDLKVGDELMGYDSNPRKILSLTSGYDQMYDILPVEKTFIKHTVNSSHILTIKDQKNNILDIKISEYNKQFKLFKYNSDKESNFKIKKSNFGEYFGFTVNGDGRVVLSDGTVTHNTTVGSRWIYGKVIKYPRARGIICANTYQQLHAATLPPVLAYFRNIGLKYTVNKRPPDEWLQRTPFQAADYKNILVVETGAHIFLRSLDNPEYIRGIEYGWGWIDEISSTTKDAWDIVIGGLRDKESLERHIRVTGTPDGDNWTWREFKKKWSTDPKAAAQFDIVFMSTRENPFIEPDLLDSMLASYDRRKALQEIDGRILTDQEANIYYEWRPIYHLKELVPYDPGKPLILCWDFNAGKEAPMSMVIAQQHNFSNGQPFVQVLDEIVILGGNTPKVCEEFLRRYYSHHRSNIYIYGDSTGRSRASTVGVNDYQMILDILKPKFHNEVYLRIPTKNMLEVDRRASMNAMFLNSKGEIRMFVSPNCKELIKDFDELTPDTHGKINKKDPSRSHTSDALGYYIAREFPVFSKQAKSFELNLNLMQR